MKILLDTDIGTDADDAYALAVALSHPAADLLAVTTVHGPVELRARIADRIISAYGRQVPIGIGAESPLSGGKAWVTGHEAENLEGGAPSGREARFVDAVGLMASVIEGNPNEVTLVAIGPMTNLALLFQRHPGIENLLAGIVFMGGSVEFREKPSRYEQEATHLMAAALGFEVPAGFLAFREHNISSDPEAAAIVFSTSVSKLMVGLNVTRHAAFPADRLAEWFANHEGPQTVRWMERRFATTFSHSVRTLHDPLALLMALQPEILKETWPVRVLIDTRGIPDPFSGDALERGRAISVVDTRSKIRAAIDFDLQSFTRLLQACLRSEPVPSA